MLIRLIKETTSGAIRFWEVLIEDATITTKYGFVGNDESARETSKEVEGKYIGKINELDPEMVAVIDTLKKIDSQLEAGYEFDTDAEAVYDELVAEKQAIDETLAERKQAREEAKEEAKAEREAKIAAKRAEKEEAEAEEEDSDAGEDLDENDEMDNDDIDV